MRRPVLLLLLLVACKPPPDAPQELDELVGYLYAHMPDADPAPLEVGADNLDDWVVDRLAETLEGYAVNDLEQTTVDALDDTERELDELAGAAVGHESAHAVQALIDATLRDDPLEIDPGTYVTYEQEVLGNTVDCFLEGDCDTLETEVWTEQNLAGITVDTNSLVQYRWVETPDGRALIQRNWLRSAASVSVDWLEVEQQYYLWVALPEDGGSRTMQVTWVVARFAGDEAPEGALNLVIDSMVKKADTLDAWVAAQ